MIGFILANLLCIAITLFVIYRVRSYVSQESIPLQIVILSITAISFYFALSVPIMLPLDIHGYDTTSYAEFWITNYWISLILSWVIIPLLMEFRDAPEFNILEKLRTGARTFLATNTLVFLVILIFIIVVMSTEGLTANTMKVILVSMSNTFGLIVVIAALGYGIIGVLYDIYHKINRDTELKAICVYIGVCKDKISTATTELQKLKNKLDTMRPHTMYQEYITQMLDSLPPTLNDNPDNNISTVRYEELVNINKGIKKHMKDYSLYNNQMHMNIMKVMMLKKDSLWNIKVRPIILTILLVGCSVMSFIVCWSEFTIPFHETILPNSVPLSLLMLSYIVFCAYHSYTEIYPDWRRDLLYSSMIVGRFAISIGLNYIDILHSAGETHDIQYYDIYETFSYYNGFSTYYPVFTLIFALCAAFNLVDRIKNYGVNTDRRDQRIDLFGHEGERLVNHEQQYMTESII